MLCDDPRRRRSAGERVRRLIGSGPSGEGWPPGKRTRERPGCAACTLVGVAATTRRAPEKDRGLSALLRTRSDWSAPGHVSPAAGLMDLRCQM
jgi:hypothetical protein